MWERRGGEVPEAWYRLPIFYFSNVSEIRGPGRARSGRPPASSELDYELEVAALIDTPALDLPAERGEEAIGGYTIFNDWSARDLQREETAVRLGPAKGKDFASSIGPWLVTPDELADAARRRRDRARPRDDRRGQRRRDVARPLVRRPVLVRRDGRAGVGRRPAATRRPARLRDRRRPAACSRSGTRRSAGTSSRATRSSLRIDAARRAPDADRGAAAMSRDRRTRRRSASAA